MQTIISIRMDETLKNNFEYICSELGMNMSTAVTIFAKKVCRERRIPFEVSIDPKYENDPKGQTKMTKFRVFIWPEMLDAPIKQIEKTFDSFDEAYPFLVENVLKMQEEIFHLDDFQFNTSLCYYAIEILNPKSIDKQAIYHDDNHNFALVYIKNDIESEIKIPTDHEDEGYTHEEILQAIKNFVTTLQTEGVI